MKFKFKLPRIKPVWFDNISARRNGKILIELNADLGEEKTFAIATKKKDLKQFKKSDVDIVYHQKKGRFFFNGNGVQKGWGRKDTGGLIGTVKGKPKPVLSSDSLIGFKLFSEETKIVNEPVDTSKPEEPVDTAIPEQPVDTSEPEETVDISEPEEPADNSEPDPILKPIEKKGNTKLFEDESGFAWISFNSGSLENTIKLADAIGPFQTVTPYGSYMAAETVNNSNLVVYSNSPPFPYIDVLKFDENWAYINTVSYEDASFSYYVAESDFKVDFNADGIVGSPESYDTTFTLIEKIGNTRLLEDEDGFAWVSISSVMAPLITQEGQSVPRDDGYGYISAAEIIDDVNYIVYSNEAGYEYQIDVVQCNDNWEIVDPASTLPNDGSNAYYSAEVDFGVDFNVDGTIGSPESSFTSIEENGNTSLLRDEFGYAWVSSNSNKFELNDPSGPILVETPFGAYVAAETINNDNYVVYSNSPPFPYIDVLRFDDNWEYMETFSHDEGSLSYYFSEEEFEVDFNADGTIGSPDPAESDDETVSLTPVETIGNAYLLQDESGNAWVSSDVYDGYLIGGEGYLKVNDGSFSISAVETLENIDYFVINNVVDLGIYISIVATDDWDAGDLYNPDVVSILYDGDFDYYRAELDFGVDFNFDSAIGMPDFINVEQEGNAYVLTDNLGRAWIESGSRFSQFQILDSPQLTQFDDGWSVRAAETWNGKNFIVDSNSSSKELMIWLVDSDWDYHKNDFYKCISHDDSEYQDAEFVFRVDFDNDGLIAGAGNVIYTCETCITFVPLTRTIHPDNVTAIGCPSFLGNSRIVKQLEDSSESNLFADINMI